MSEPTCWESIKTEGSAVLDKLKKLIREGNIRSVRVRQGERTVAIFPLTAGVVGLVVAPVLAAVATLVALLGDCTIDVEKVTTEVPKTRKSQSRCERAAGHPMVVRASSRQQGLENRQAQRCEL